MATIKIQPITRYVYQPDGSEHTDWYAYGTHVTVNGTANMAEWRYDLSTLKNKIGSKNISISNVRIDWYANTYKRYGVATSPLTYVDRGLNNNTGSIKIGTQAANGDNTWLYIENDKTKTSNTCAQLEDILNAATFSQYFYAACYCTTSNPSGEVWQGEMTITYDTADLSSIIQSCNVSTKKPVSGGSCKFSVKVCNTQSSNVTSVKTGLYTVSGSTYTLVSNEYTNSASIAHNALATFTNTLTLNNVFSARATAIALRVTLTTASGTTATDTETGIVNVLDKLYSPKIELFDAQRYDATLWHEVRDDGESLSVDLKIGYDGTTLPSGGNFAMKLYAAEGDVDETSYSNVWDVTSSLTTAMIASLKDGVAGNTALFSAVEISNELNRNLLLVFGDEYEKAYSNIVSIAKYFANVHLSGASTGGVCFGGISTATENNPLFECKYPTYFESDVHVSGTFYGGVDYSSNEIPLGYNWIDGKPLYQRVYTFTNITSKDISSVNMDACLIEVFANTGWTSNNNVYWHPSYCAGGDTDYVSVFRKKTTSTDELCLAVGSSVTINSIYVVVKYTKTTDSAS